MLAFGVPSSAFNRIVPAVAVYFISCPPMCTECLVTELFSSGVFLSLSSLGFSAEGAAGGAACCAGVLSAASRPHAAKLKDRNRRFIGRLPQDSCKPFNVPARIVCDRQNHVK